MADLVPTPAEIAEYEKSASAPAAAPAQLNPIRDLSADELYDLATKDKEGFDVVNEFRRNKPLWGDPNLVQKVADVHDRVKERGFQMSDLPGPGKIASTAFDIAKGFGKQAWNYANALVGVPIASAIGEVTGDSKNPGFNTELAQEGQRRVMENLAGTEGAVVGMMHTGQKAVRKVINAAAGYSGAEDKATPEQKVQNLWNDVGMGETEEEALKGKGGLLTPIGANVREELEAAGKPIRPEETQALSAGDPLSFYTFGKAFQGAGKIVPAPVGAAVDNVVSKAGDIAETIAGKAVKGAGKLTELGGKATKFAGPTVGLIKGAIEAGPLGALAGLKGGEIAAKAGAKISKVGEKVAAMGDEIAGKAPVTTGTAQLVKDVAGSVPAAAAEVGKGAAFDIGTAAVSSESPQDTESTGIGTFFGGLGAAKRVGGRVMSGQIVGPREWGSNTFVGSSGQHQALEHMHIEAIKDATPAVKTRVNAIREFLKGTGANTDVFLAKDPASMEKALVDSGIKPDQAKTFADQEGFVLTNLPGKDGKPRRVILANNIDAAPHEAFHAIQDVLGETANQQIDQIVRQEYGNQWETLGQRYADRIQPGGDWRETILDSTGTGLDYAKEKIAMNVGNEYRAATGAEPTSDYVQARTKEIFGQVMDKAVQANPNIDPNQIAQHAWRDVLSPQEATAVADTYLSRELAAENFDMVFKNLGASLNNQGLVGRLARVVANLVSTLGGEPLSPERRSQIGDIAPKFRVAEAVRTAPELITPKVQKAPSEGKKITLNEPLLPSPKINEPSPADEARQIASDAAKAAPKSGTASPREVLGFLAEAIAQKSGVKINYLSAPGEPAAATSSNREARRTTIEAFRKMPPEARVMWEKNFFPERVIKLKGDKYQVMGWAPEVFAANAHKLAEKLVELGVSDASPYPIAEGTFTPDGWKQLYDDTQKFVKNQMAGRTGAGEPLVIPKNVTDAGFFAPAQRNSPAGLEQTKADFINMLFNFRLPDTARLQKGKLPLNIAGQDVSAATKPGRVEVPVIPRGQFTGDEAQRQGIEGRQVMEVNPLRQRIEAAAQAKGVAMPEFIEAIQRLNVENIKDVKITPEQPQFRGNTLTLSAGFQPSTESRAVKSAAVKDENGKVHEGFWHGAAQEKAQDSGAKGPFADGFTTNGGEFLGRPEAFDRAKETGQIAEDAKPGAMDENNKPGLENSQLMGKRTVAKFQPPKTSEEAEELVKSVAKMSPTEFYGWAHNTPGGMTEAAHQTGLNATSQGFVNLLKAASDSFGKKAADLATTDIEAAMNVATQQQFFREAWEAATGEGSAGYAFRKEDPNWKPKFPVNVNTSETILQKKVLDSGTENAHNGENMSTQLQPKTAKKEFKMKPAKGGFSKAWILPDGTPVQLGGQWHHDFINESPELRKKYDLPVDDNTEQNRIEALKAGFVRVNWADASGRMTIEAREKDWPRQRDAVRSMVERNASKIDAIKVYLFNDSVSDIKHSDDVKVMTLDDVEKPAMIPFLDLGDKRATGDASDRLFQKAVDNASKPKAEFSTKLSGAYWVDPKGEIVPVSDTHEMTAYELNRDGKVNLDLDNIAKAMDRDGVEALYAEMGKRKYLRAYNVDEKTIGLEGPGRWEHLPRVQREAIEDAASAKGLKVFYNNKGVDTTGLPEVGAMFQPKSVKDVADEYAKRAKIEYVPSTTRADVPEETAKKVADFYEAAKDAPDSPEVKKSYDALVKETVAQYRTIKAGGYDIEPWSGKGEPYDSSAAMIKDVNENKHLYFLPTKGNFKGKEKNPMLEPSGEGDFLVNDIFRAVHDFFGHAKENLQFGPKGEFNAWRVHSEMYSPEAQGALAAETLAQNFWVNYGKHLRRPDASVPKRGDQDFRPLADRPFAEQKNMVIPDEMLKEVRSQFQPKREEDLFGNKQMFSPREVSEMSPDEIKEFFPEAVVPSKAKELIPRPSLNPHCLNALALRKPPSKLSHPS
jgi:hypothetical protein